MKEISTQEKLVKETARLVQEKGYFGTGISEILQNSGVPKGSLYHHFPKGKDSLVVASLSYSSKWMINKYQEAMRGTKTPLAGLSAILDVLAEHLQLSNFHLGCPLATVALESSATKPEIRAALSDMYATWEQQLCNYLRLKQVTEPERKARLFLTLLEGGLLLSKAHGDVSFLKRIKDDLASILPG